MGFTLTDVLLFGGAKESDVDSAAFAIMRRNILRWGAIGGYVSIIVHGVPPLVLPDAIEGGLVSLKAFGGTEQRNLPDGYIERQFIYMMDGSYLAVENQSITSDYKIEFDFATTNLPSSLANYFGARASGVSAGGGFRLSKLSNNGVAMYGFDTTDAYESGANVLAANTRYKYVYDNGTCTLSSGGTDVLTHTYTVNDTSTITAFGINAYTSNGTSYSASGLGIYCYGLKLWNGQGELVMNLVPAVQKGTVPVVGFYDTVSETFMTATSGTFAAGGEAVPTPDAPIDIVCNNGVLKYSPNIFDKDNRERIVGYFASSGTQWSYATNAYCNRIPCKPNTKYTARYNGSGTQAVLGFGSTSNDDVPPLVSGGSITITQAIRQNSPTINTPITITTGPNDKWLIVAYNYTDPQNTDMADNLQIEESAVATTYQAYKPTRIWTDGTVETIAIKDDQSATISTATCEDLLSVGDYTDEQEIIGGTVTRKVGVKVLDGTENFIIANPTYIKSDSTDAYFNFSQAVSGNTVSLCNQLKYSTGPIWSSVGYTDCFRFNNKQLHLNVNNASLGITDYTQETTSSASAKFKAWLADQYAAGTPVIVIYPLATPTTESVTGQTLQVTDGDNVLEITQASLNNLELEAQYNAAVSLTIQEVQDANLDNNVTVTIQ